ncbi:MAG: hypothetical protein ISS41_04865 [Candidatus Aminicenantes bacterium]|nr:hypothetical protein [Candidatus Aminicenantes bacterium]MBL7082949.1 hypothetical protein [Candidatus Aminicenantes bacterium]
MWLFNSIFGRLFEFIFFPFINMSPWIGMIFISFLTALLMLFIFRFTSNQQGIRQVKKKIIAHLLELRLFKDSLSITLKAQGNILRYNLKYIGYSAKPMLVLIIPIFLILVQLNLWFGYQDLAPGQKAILKVKMEEGHDLFDINIAIEPSSALNIETSPLRIEEEREINWRFLVKEKGVHDITFIINGQRFTKKIAAAQNPLSKISQSRVQRNFIDELFNPGEAPLPGDIPLKTIEVTYPPQRMNLLGWHIHWLIVYFALSIIFGFSFKGIFKVEI